MATALSEFVLKTDQAGVPKDEPRHLGCQSDTCVKVADPPNGGFPWFLFQPRGQNRQTHTHTHTHILRTSARQWLWRWPGAMSRTL